MAAMKAADPRVSFADLERWPESGRRYELYDGEVYVIPSPLLLHQIAAGRLYVILSDYVRERGGMVLFAPPGTTRPCDRDSVSQHCRQRSRAKDAVAGPARRS